MKNVTKPDRWERMVDRYMAKDGRIGPSLYPREAAAFLRREHQAVVRVVKKLDTDCDSGPMFRVGYRLALSRVLTALAKRAR